jgi:hypothetical protein
MSFTLPCLIKYQQQILYSISYTQKYNFYARFREFLVSHYGPNKKHPKTLLNILIPACTGAITALKVMCKYCGKFFGCDLDPHFLNHISKFLICFISVLFLL